MVAVENFQSLFGKVKIQAMAILNPIPSHLLEDLPQLAPPSPVSSSDLMPSYLFLNSCLSSTLRPPYLSITKLLESVVYLLAIMHPFTLNSKLPPPHLLMAFSQAPIPHIPFPAVFDTITQLSPTLL